MDNKFSEYDKYLTEEDEYEDVYSNPTDEYEDIFSKSAKYEEPEYELTEEDIPISQPKMTVERNSREMPKKAPKNAPKKAIKKRKDGLKKKLGILCGAAGVSEIAAFLLLLKVNMLPMKFVILIAVAFLLLFLVIWGLMFSPSRHRFGKRKLAATILAVITIVSCIIGIIMMGKLLGTIDSVVTGKKIKTSKIDDPYIVYISGSDTRDNKLSEKTRSDVNILMVVNPKTHQILLLNTPRDYYVMNPAYNGMDKLTHCGLGGVENSMKALCDLYGLDEIDYDARINFTGFEKLVDAVGGIDIYSEVAFTTQDGSSVQIVKGENHLNGAQALAYARERHAFASGDLARGEHQMEVIKAIANKMMSSTALISNYMGIMSSLSGMFETDMPQALFQYMVKDMLNGGGSGDWDIKSYAVTGKSAFAVCATSGQSLSVIIRDEASVEQAKEYIRQVMDGEALTIE